MLLKTVLIIPKFSFQHAKLSTFYRAAKQALHQCFILKTESRPVNQAQAQETAVGPNSATGAGRVGKGTKEEEKQIKKWKRQKGRGRGWCWVVGLNGKTGTVDLREARADLTGQVESQRAILMGLFDHTLPLSILIFILLINKWLKFSNFDCLVTSFQAPLPWISSHSAPSPPFLSSCPSPSPAIPLGNQTQGGIQVNSQWESHFCCFTVTIIIMRLNN